MTNAELASLLGLSLRSMERYRHLPILLQPRWLRLAMAALDAGLEPADLPPPELVGRRSRKGRKRQHTANGIYTLYKGAY